MPSQIRAEQIEKLAEKRQGYPAWKVTTYSPRTSLVDFVYYVCGKCSLKEKDCPSLKPEKREVHRPNGAPCAYCGKTARPS